MHALIVDDSRFLRQWMVRSLSRLGWQCTEAEHGGIALEVLQAGGSRFDLMLVDANMPVLGGIDCLRAMQQHGPWPSMKIMMVTTEADMEFVEAALALGADEFLMKPVTDEVLSSKLLLLGLAGGR